MDSNTPKPSPSQPNTQQSADEADLRMREIAIKERELALKEQEVRSRIKLDSQGTWLSSSLLVAISGLLGTGLGAALQGYSNIHLERQKFDANFQLERQKFEFALIQKALETTDTEEAVRRLEFMVDSGVLQSLDSSKIKSIAKHEPEKIPSFSVSSLIPDATNFAAKDKTRDLERQILFVMQKNNPNSLVSILDLNVEVFGNSNLHLLQPLAKMALKKAIEKRGKTLVLNASYRPLISQHLLASCAKKQGCGLIHASNPGQSPHNAGLAIDIQDYEGWKPYLQAEGWKWDPADPVHFEIEGNQAFDIGKLSIKAFQQLWNQNYPEEKISENGIYDAETQEKLNKTPADGFPIGEKCSTQCGF
jgi:hypothetical protein